MYSRTDETITLTMTPDQYRMLLIALGFAAGCAQEDKPDLFPLFVALTNELNEGNPQYAPYEVPKV